MKYLFGLIACLLFCSTIFSQEITPGKTKFVIGIAGPELLHAGVTYRITQSNLLGLTAGAGPSLRSIWPTINLEHRLYLGKKSEKTGQKLWFFRQGTTFFPLATLPSQHFTLNATVGKDFPFKKVSNGITIDLGAFYLADSESSSIILIRSLNLWPALRFQFYFSL